MIEDANKLAIEPHEYAAMDRARVYSDNDDYTPVDDILILLELIQKLKRAAGL